MVYPKPVKATWVALSAGAGIWQCNTPTLESPENSSSQRTRAVLDLVNASKRHLSFRQPEIYATPFRHYQTSVAKADASRGWNEHCKKNPDFHQIIWCHRNLRCNAQGLVWKIEARRALQHQTRSSKILFSNDPSAGSPTETLLRLLLPLNDQVWSASQRQSAVSGSPKPIRRPH